jgi:hypothetical protein
VIPLEDAEEIGGVFILEPGIKTGPILVCALDYVSSGLSPVQILEARKCVLQVIAKLGWLVLVSIFEFGLSEVPSILPLNSLFGNCDERSVEVEQAG